MSGYKQIWMWIKTTWPVLSRCPYENPGSIAVSDRSALIPTSIWPFKIPSLDRQKFISLPPERIFRDRSVCPRFEWGPDYCLIYYLHQVIRSENCGKLFPTNKIHHNSEPYSLKLQVESYNRFYRSVRLDHEARISQYSLIWKLKFYFQVYTFISVQ